MASVYKAKVYPSPSIIRAGAEKLPAAPPNPQHYCFNIRGTNGSGKSFATRLVLDQSGPELRRFEMFDGLATIIEYENLFVVGTYDTDCGGLDTIPDSKIINPIVLDLIDKKHVLIEGMMRSTIFGETHELNKQLRLKGHELIQYGFTGSVGLFIDRVLKRRAGKGNFKPYSVINMIKKVPPITHSMNHSIFFGGAVVFGQGDEIAQHINGIISGTILDPSESFLAEYQFYDDFEEWERKVEIDPLLTLMPKSEHIEQKKAEVAQLQKGQANLLFGKFGA